jgi:hypothetical protein
MSTTHGGGKYYANTNTLAYLETTAIVTKKVLWQRHTEETNIMLTQTH